jgi:hypothetical protein
MAELVLPGVGRTVASFGFARSKTWPFMIMLLAMMAIGLGRVWTHGLDGEWGIAVILILIPAVAFVMVLGELRLEGPILVIGEDGLLDRRRGPAPVGWSSIQEATIKRRVFNKGIRIMLTDGARYDIELNLLAADPALVMRHIQERAAAAAGAQDQAAEAADRGHEGRG